MSYKKLWIALLALTQGQNWDARQRLQLLQ